MPTDVVVAQKDDLENGEMKQVTADGTDLLLARTGGRYLATYAYCSHYGAPLVDGALSGDRVVCPWHHACFHLKDGRQMEPPGQDGLPAFDVRTDGDDVIVTLPDGDVPEAVPAEMAARSTPSGGAETLAVVLGGGAAGAYAVEGLREGGFDGRIVLVTAEHFHPYDRINVSKGYLAGEAGQPADLVLRDASFYDEHDIDVLQGRTVERVEAAAQRLVFDDGEAMEYDRLVLATGATPRRLDVEGADLAGIHTLRVIGDSDAIQDAARTARHAVVVGSSFIGMEAASSLRQISEAAGTDLSITVVSPDAVPFASLLGDDVGQRLRQMHEEEGDIAFRLGENVVAFEGTDRVESVTLEGGDAVPADLVVVGIGVEPATDLVEGIEKADDGGLVVDEQLQAQFTDGGSAAGSLFAAGDVAQFPYWLRGGEPTRIEHWRLACQLGRLAGRNAAGADDAYRSVPFFWSAQHGTNMRYVGHAKDFDDVILDGDLDALAFIAFYVEAGRVQAALGIGRDEEMAALEELMRREAVPAPDAIADADLVALLRTAAEQGDR